MCGVSSVARKLGADVSNLRDRRIPSTRAIEPELRRKRLLAARQFAAGSVPRAAIMLGQWDGGEVVASAGVQLKEPKNALPKSLAKSRKRPPQGREE